MGRTLRGKSDRFELWNFYEGRCAICKCQLDPKNWHADHIIPYRIEQRTELSNMQALCPACNLKKGGKHMALRKHQREAQQIAIDVRERATNKKSFIAWVVPGGGKSWMAPLMLKELGDEWRLAWFVPRLTLREQAAIQSQKSPHHLKLMACDDLKDPMRGFRGVVATHQYLYSQPKNWKTALENERRKGRKLLVVFDELHHANSDIRDDVEPNKTWLALDNLPYDCRLLMTGTIESNAGLVYGLEYEKCDQGYTPKDTTIDIRYSRCDALAEGAIVPVEFHHLDGPVRWSEPDGTEVEQQLSQVSFKDANKGKITALDTGIADQLFDAGIQHWKDYGYKLLILAPDRPLAREYFKRCKKIDDKSFLAISGDEKCSVGECQDFDNHRGRAILVTCAVAYEGLDVPSITHGICLSRYRSKPWIEQAFARAWRSHGTKKNCWWFVPDDPLMNRVINDIRAETPQLIRHPRDDNGNSGGFNEEAFIPLDSYADSGRVTSLDSHDGMNAKQREVLETFRKVGLAEDCPEVQAVLNKLGEPDVPPHSERTPREDQQYYRKALDNTIKRRLDRSIEPKDIRIELKAKFGGKGVNELRVHELKEAIRYVKAKYCA